MLSMAERGPQTAKAKEDDFDSLIDPVNFNIARQRERIQEHVRLGLPEPPTPVKHLDALCSTHDCDWDESTTVDILCKFRDEGIEELIGQFQVIVHHEKPLPDAFVDSGEFDRRLKAWRVSVGLLANLYAAAVWYQQMRFLRDAGKTEVFSRQVALLNAAKEDPSRRPQLQELQDTIRQVRGGLTQGAGEEAQRSLIDGGERAKDPEGEKLQQEEREALEATFSHWELDVINRFAAKLRKPATAPRRRPLTGRREELAKHIEDLAREVKHAEPSLRLGKRQTARLEKESDHARRPSSSALQDRQASPSGLASRTAAATGRDSAVVTGQESTDTIQNAVIGTSNNIPSGSSSKVFIDHNGRAHVRGSKGQFQRKDGGAGERAKTKKRGLTMSKARSGAAAPSSPDHAAPTAQEAATSGAGAKRNFSDILDEAPESKNEAISRTVHPKRVKILHTGPTKGKEGQTTSEDASGVAAGDVADGDVAAGDVNAGDVAAGDVNVAAGSAGTGNVNAGVVDAGHVNAGASLQSDSGAGHQSIDSERQGIDDERSKIVSSGTELPGAGQNMHSALGQDERRTGVADVVAPIEILARSPSPANGPGTEVFSNSPAPARRRLILRNSGPRPPASSSS